MKKEQEGIVIDTAGSVAKIKVSRHGDCKNCGSCPGDSAMVLDAQNPINAKPGQHVVFEVKEVNMLKAAFIVYILPLIATFIGVAAGQLLAKKLGYNVSTFQIIGGVAAFILSTIYIKKFDKSAGSDISMQPVIIRSL